MKRTTGGMTKESYPFRSSEAERQRLIAQDGLVAPSTRRLFEQAGIASGMRVLDIGSGPGGVAFLAPRMVGPAGEVVAGEARPAHAGLAPRRGRADRATHRRFCTGEFREGAAHA